MTNQEFITKLQSAYPMFRFKSGPRFSFRTPKTIYYLPNDPNLQLLILHELGHALLGHKDFATDVERLKIERAAWDKASELCQQFSVPYMEDFIEAELDSYRNWLHTKSLCKKCGLTRFQTKDGRYHCPHCDQ